jgi:hypothetical protein
MRYLTGALMDIKMHRVHVARNKDVWMKRVDCREVVRILSLKITLRSRDVNRQELT